jgi:hypothetical protein
MWLINTQTYATQQRKHILLYSRNPFPGFFIKDCYFAYLLYNTKTRRILVNMRQVPAGNNPHIPRFSSTSFTPSLYVVFSNFLQQSITTGHVINTGLAWKHFTPNPLLLISPNSLSLLFRKDSFLRKKSTGGNTLLNGAAQYFSRVAHWRPNSRTCTIETYEDSTVEAHLACTRLYVLLGDLSFCLSWKQLSLHRPDRLRDLPSRNFSLLIM